MISRWHSWPLNFVCYKQYVPVWWYNTSLVVQDCLQNAQIIIGEDANPWISQSNFTSCLEPILTNCMAHEKNLLSNVNKASTLKGVHNSSRIWVFFVRQKRRKVKKNNNTSYYIVSGAVRFRSSLPDYLFDKRNLCKL